ncbi:MAG: hypothetical protein M1334_04185 [Patescibacteria group bacterium]|nr:hypothetical protein [Patescibacteria group bacterium]
MIKLNFILSEDFLLQHILKSHSDHLPFMKIKKKVWDINKNFYDIASQNIEPIIFDDGLAKGLPVAIVNLNGNLAKIYKTPEFKKAVAETKKYLNYVKGQWEDNYGIAILHLTNITKIDLSKINKEINIYISHPKLNRGRSYVENNAIAWSHREDWKNYSTVYLWHEIMHIITFNKSIAPNLMHATIELSCDNELRIRLGGANKYFEESGFPIGHRLLSGFERKIIPDWKEYLKNPKENIYQFEKRMRKKYQKEKFLRSQSKLAEWAEWH